MSLATTEVYDSARPRKPLIAEAQNFWSHRGLIRLLVAKDLTLRYKRSFLGVWWTLLMPLLTALVMWMIFSQVFGRAVPGDQPFIVYLLSGIIIVQFFAQGLVAAGSAGINSRSVLGKVYVPAEVFSLASATAALAHFFIGMAVLLLIQVLSGWGIPWTVILTPIPALLMLALITGLGLIVASLAMYFYDVLEFVKVVTQLLAYMVPTFYPITMFQGRTLDILGFSVDPVTVIKSNPLYSYLVAFRGFVYEGAFSPWWTFVVMLVSSSVALVLGVWVFSKNWKNVVAML